VNEVWWGRAGLGPGFVIVMPRPPATVRLVDALADGSATEVAVIVTGSAVGGRAAGAVYVAVAPLAVVAGDTEPQGAVAHETPQLTPRLPRSLLTVAVI